MKKNILLLTVLLAVLLLGLTAVSALADGEVINLLTDPDAEWSFEEGADILEVVFPIMIGRDSCVVRLNDQVMVVDAGTNAVYPKLREVLQRMNIERVDIAFNSHPHDDHIDGFRNLPGEFEVGEMVITIPEDEYNWRVAQVKKYMDAAGVPMVYMDDGDTFTLGDAQLTVIRREERNFAANDTSALLKLEWHGRTMLFMGDIENRAWKSYASNPPECGLQAEVIKYPHHGIQPVSMDLLRIIQPKVAVITNTPEALGVKWLKQHDIPVVTTEGYGDPVRLRSDGHIWVLDTLKD